jgi:hypothetical protein
MEVAENILVEGDSLHTQCHSAGSISLLSFCVFLCGVAVRSANKLRSHKWLLSFLYQFPEFLGAELRR